MSQKSPSSSRALYRKGDLSIPDAWLLHAHGVYDAWDLLREYNNNNSNKSFQLHHPVQGLALKWAWASREDGDLRFLPRWVEAWNTATPPLRILVLRDAPFFQEDTQNTAVSPPQDAAYREFWGHIVPAQLGSHLQVLIVEDCTLSASYLHLFGQSMLRCSPPSSPLSSPLLFDHSFRALQRLEFRRTHLTDDAVRALVALLDQSSSHHSNSNNNRSRMMMMVCPLHTLVCEDAHVSTWAGNALLQAVRHNTTLRTLVLERNRIQDLDQASGAAMAASQIESLVLLEPLLGLMDDDDPPDFMEGHHDDHDHDHDHCSHRHHHRSSNNNRNRMRSMEPIRRFIHGLTSSSSSSHDCHSASPTPTLKLLHIPICEGRDVNQVHPVEAHVANSCGTNNSGNGGFLIDVQVGTAYSSTDGVYRRIQHYLHVRNPFVRQVHDVFVSEGDHQHHSTTAMQLLLPHIVARMLRVSIPPLLTPTRTTTTTPSSSTTMTMTAASFVSEDPHAVLAVASAATCLYTFLRQHYVSPTPRAPPSIIHPVE